MKRLRNVGPDKFRVSRSQVVLMVEKLQELMLVLVEVSDLRDKSHDVWVRHMSKSSNAQQMKN